mgnify:FL=1
MLLSWVFNITSNVVGTVYPAYASFKALNTKEPEDDQHWLTYWIVYGLVTSVHNFMAFWGFRLPFYDFLSIFFFLWLQLPITRGAHKLYKLFVEPFFAEREEAIDNALSRILVHTLRGIKNAIFRFFTSEKGQKVIQAAQTAEEDENSSVLAAGSQPSSVRGRDSREVEEM